MVLPLQGRQQEVIPPSLLADRLRDGTGVPGDPAPVCDGTGGPWGSPTRLGAALTS